MTRNKMIIVELFILALGLLLGFSFRKEIECYRGKVIRRLSRMFGQSRSVIDQIYPIISDAQKNKLAGDIKLSYLGDLILLRDMIERERGSFDGMFSHIRKYLAESDMAFGVFEGPCAGESKGWSTSVFDDNIPFRLNFPDAYARAVKMAGIDFVTTANNHVLDQGIEGALRTLDVLDGVGIEHVGSYRNAEAQSVVKIVEIRGKRAVVLAYTYGAEHCSFEDLLDGPKRHITNVIAARHSKFYGETRRRVATDFERAKRLSPDLIIVMPHLGREFRHSPDEDQVAWCNYFVELGADLVLADHPHAVQPIEWRRRKDGKRSLIVYCPGNFINSYVRDDGDASMLVEIYLDRRSAEPIGAAIVPIYAYGRPNGNYVGMPVYDLWNDNEFLQGLSLTEKKRISEVHRIVTKSALGVELSVDQRQPRYYFLPDVGYARNKVLPLSMNKIDHGDVYQLLSSAKSICFVGDSITEGSKNGGYGWYEPIAELFSEKRIDRFARGGATVHYIVQNSEKIAAFKSDLYVVAIGCNDIRYRDKSICAMTADAYVEELQKFKDVILQVNPNAQFVFVAPWLSRWFDPYCKVSEAEKLLLYGTYCDVLKCWCATGGGAKCVNLNDFVSKRWVSEDALVDHIHPNATEGIRLYSEALLAQ